MLVIKNLRVNYGVIPALKGISIEVKQGEIVSLIGANGAGKTTTLRTISGLNRASSGTINFLGKDIIKERAHNIVKIGVSHMPEGRGIFPNLTVTENIFLGAYLRNDKTETNKDVKWVHDLFPRLLERKNQSAGTLSGGELQMLAMARALMMRPKLLLLDEPSMGLAPLLVSEIFQIIKEINKGSGVTILLVEQNARKALNVSNRAYVLETGNVTNSGESQDLINNEDIKKAYLGV